jgi:hypothetical protein
LDTPASLPGFGGGFATARSQSGNVDAQRAMRDENISFGAGKPDSVPPACAGFGRHFSQTHLAMDLPHRRPAFAGLRQGAAYPRLWDGPPSRLFCLAPDGVFPATNVAVGAVGSYPTFSPLPGRTRLAADQTGRFVFCDTVRCRALKRDACARLAAGAASCPMVSGLSSPRLSGAALPAPWDQRTRSNDQAPKLRGPT